MRPKVAKELKAGSDPVRRALHGRVIRVPWLQDVREPLPQDLSQREERDPIEGHRQWVPLCDPLLAEYDLGLAARLAADQPHLVSVAVKGEARETRAAVLHCPYHDVAAEAIETVCRVN